MSSTASSRKTRLIPLLAVSALAGGLTGLLFRPAGPAAQAPGGVRKITAARAAPGGAAAGKSLEPRIQALVDSLWKPATPSGQIAAALEFAALTSVDDIRSLLDHSRRFPPHSGEEVAIGTLLKRWLELDPETAMAYCRRNKPEFLARLAGGWALSDPEKATAWVRALPASENPQDAWMELCAATSLRDSGKAWGMMARIPGLNLEGGTWPIDAGVRRMVSRDLDGAIAGMDSMPPSILAAARKAIAAELTRRDPAAGWEWARSQPNPREAMGAALSTALAGDPAQALGFMKSVPVEELAGVIEQSGHNWRLGNLREFTDQLTGDTALDPKARQIIADRLFGRAIWSNPEEAQSLIPLLSAESLTQRVRDYVQSRGRQDPAAARAWIDSLPEGPARDAAVEARAAFIPEKPAADRTSPESLADDLKRGNYIRTEDPRLARMTAEQVGRLIDGLPQRESYRAMEVLGRLGTANPKTAAAWLENTVINETTGPAAAQFSSRWAENDPAAAAAWVKTLPPGDLARTAAENVARQYQLYAPAEAAAWLNALPPGAVRDAARKGMPPR